jgi:hypothetical protein
MKYFGQASNLIGPISASAMGPAITAQAPVINPPSTGFNIPMKGIFASFGIITAVIGLATIIGPILAYHGYKRNDDSIIWALAWLIAGAGWPVLLPVALIQGFAKPAE